MVTNVGRGAGTPGNVAVDFLNDPQWNNSAKTFLELLAIRLRRVHNTRFTTDGLEVTEANVLPTGVPPFTFALPASVTTIVRTNLDVLGDVWDNTSGSGLWSDAANWADNTEPTAASTVIFPVGFPNGDSVITLSAAETAAALTLNDNYTLSGGSLTLPAGATISVAAGKDRHHHLRPQRRHVDQVGRRDPRRAERPRRRPDGRRRRGGDLTQRRRRGTSVVDIEL